MALLPDFADRHSVSQILGATSYGFKSIAMSALMQLDVNRYTNRQLVAHPIRLDQGAHTIRVDLGASI